MKFNLLIRSLLIISLFGCTNDAPNEKPRLDFSYSLNGLTVEVTGDAVDVDGEVVKFEIKWGDSNSETLYNKNLIGLVMSHHYSTPGEYTIDITATDNEDVSTTQSFVLIIDYAITSLNGIKQSMFKTSNDEFLILTINLHTYQEEFQNEKFNLIVDAIGMMNIDFILFQECAQLNTSPSVSGIIRNDNMALIISKRLVDKYGVNYNYSWDWAHYGWNVWEEGVAILSKHPLVESESRYISVEQSKTSITSRKVIYCSHAVSNVGRLNIFSAHTHWRTTVSDEEQNNQIKNIKLMVDEKELAITDQKVISFVGGDFNGNPTSDYPWSEGYNTMVQNGSIIDTFLEINTDANTRPALSMYNTIGGDLPGRIDYIFMKSNPYFKVMDSQIVFTNQIIGRVSDHFGVITKIKYFQ